VREAGSAEPAETLAPSRESLVQVLRREGPLTLASLVSRVGLSRSAVAYHLHDLGRAGLVERRPVRHGVGRPHDLYDVTPLAQELPPTGYRGLAASLLEAARQIGGQGLEARIFEERRLAQLHALRQRLVQGGLASAPIFERAAVVAQFLDDAGYECAVDRRGAVRLCEHHCPILEIARHAPTACDAELRLIADALEADVVRESHIAAGARTCTYRLRARGWDSRGWDVSQYAPGPTNLDSSPRR
jgi:predicted ArsR family transcriptional regulator